MSKNNTSNRVLIIEPFPVVAYGLKSLIDELVNFEVAGVVTGNCHYYLERIISAHPDIVILNPQILDYKNRINIAELTAKTGCDNIIALVTQILGHDYINHYKGVISISDDVDRIAGVLRKIINADKNPEVETNELSSREKEILVYVAKGMMNKEIADKCNLSIHTVITHRKNIAKKVGIKSVSGLTVYAIINNFIDIQDIE